MLPLRIAAVFFLIFGVNSNVRAQANLVVNGNFENLSHFSTVPSFAQRYGAIEYEGALGWFGYSTDLWINNFSREGSVSGGLIAFGTGFGAEDIEKTGGWREILYGTLQEQLVNGIEYRVGYSVAASPSPAHVSTVSLKNFAMGFLNKISVQGYDSVIPKNWIDSISPAVPLPSGVAIGDHPGRWIDVSDFRYVANGTEKMIAFGFFDKPPMAPSSYYFNSQSKSIYNYVNVDTVSVTCRAEVHFDIPKENICGQEIPIEVSEIKNAAGYRWVLIPIDQNGKKGPPIESAWTAIPAPYFHPKSVESLGQIFDPKHFVNYPSVRLKLEAYCHKNAPEFTTSYQKEISLRPVHLQITNDPEAVSGTMDELAVATDYQFSVGIREKLLKNDPIESAQWIFSDDPATVVKELEAEREFLTNGQHIVTVSTIQKSGCVSSVSRIYELNDPLACIPSAFSPDGNGINDFFGPGCEGLDIHFLKIFNRWGEQIYETGGRSYSPWDGGSAKAGVYVYRIRYRRKGNLNDKQNEKIIELKGTVQLLL